MAPVGVIESSRNSAAAAAGAGEPKKAKRLPPNAAMAAGTTGEFTLASYRKTGVGQAGSRAGQGLGGPGGGRRECGRRDRGLGFDNRRDGQRRKEKRPGRDGHPLVERAPVSLPVSSAGGGLTLCAGG